MKGRTVELLIDEEKEMWRPVVGYEEEYLVSSMGRVRQIPKDDSYKHDAMTTSPNQCLKPFKKGKKSKYYQVSLYRNGRQQNKNLAHIVCETYHGSKAPDDECRHINDIAFDNRAVNLSWGPRTDDKLDDFRGNNSLDKAFNRAREVDRFDDSNDRQVIRSPDRIIARGILQAVHRGFFEKTIAVLRGEHGSERAA